MSAIIAIILFAVLIIGLLYVMVQEVKDFKRFRQIIKEADDLLDEIKKNLEDEE